MRLEIRMPRKSEFSDDGKIARWLVSVGDVVTKGDPIAEVEVDMTTAELLAEADGKIVEIWVHAGQSVPVETVIAMQSVADEAIADNTVDDDEDTGDMGTEEEPASEEVGSENPEGEESEFPEMSEEALASVADTSSDNDEAVVQHGHVLASPSAVQLAEQYNINLETLTGTGSCGRIERADVEAAMQTTSQFITPEDVDDLMNFDGDFSSEFSDSGVETEQVQALAEDAAAETDEEQIADEPVAEQFAAESAVEKTETDIEGVSEEAASDPSGEVADLPDEEAAQPSETAVAEPSEEDITGSDQDKQEQDSEAMLAASDEDQLQDDVEQETEQDAGSLAAVAENETTEESAGDDETPAERSVVYMDGGPEAVAAMSAEEESQPDAATDEPVDSEEGVEEETQPEAATDEPGVSEEGAEEEPQETEISVEVPSYEEEPMAEERQEAEVSADAEFEVSQSEDAQQSADADDKMDEPEAAAVSAYEPTEEERDAVAGFSAMSASVPESEAIAVDESDTIGLEEDDIESAVDDELASEPEPVQLDSATVATAIEQATAKESRKSVKIRRLVARKMEQSWQHAPHFFVTVAVDMTDVIRFRSDLGVTINDFILAATTRALQEHPWVNSHFVNDEAVEQPEVNISLAVETEQGLFYPVVKGCGGKSVKDLGISAAELVVKAHSGKLSDEDMEGGSFTISNMGMLGVESFSAIITPPQVAVLAVGTVRGEVIIDEHEEMTMAPMVRLTLSADHRALDGADAADFLGTMKSYLEAPITLVASQDE